MDTHTPGPWLIATSNSWRRIVSQHGDVICGQCNQPDGHPDLTFPNGGADGPDARLMAAAPDLLEAARAAEAIFTRQKWGGDGDDPETVALRLSRAAIAKAMGSAA